MHKISFENSKCIKFDNFHIHLAWFWLLLLQLHSLGWPIVSIFPMIELIYLKLMMVRVKPLKKQRGIPSSTPPNFSILHIECLCIIKWTCIKHSWLFKNAKRTWRFQCLHYNFLCNWHGHCCMNISFMVFQCLFNFQCM